VVKSKVAIPFRVAELDLRFDHGVDAVGGLLDLGLNLGLVTKVGEALIYQQTRLGTGRERARGFLRQHADLAAKLHQQLSTRLEIGGQPS
jgi:recombination protein RecA